MATIFLPKFVSQEFVHRHPTLTIPAAYVSLDYCSYQNPNKDLSQRSNVDERAMGRHTQRHQR